MKNLPKNQAAPALPEPSSPAPSIRLARRKKAEPEPENTRTTPDQRLLNRAIAGLGKKAGGHVTCEVKTTYEVDADGAGNIKNRVVTHKQNPPDLAAIIFALTNIESEKWRAKPGEAAPNPETPPQTDLSGLAAIPDDLLRGILKYFPAKETLTGDESQ